MTCPIAVACDLARQTGALETHELRDRVADLEADRDSYRELLRGALAGWHETLDERDRLRREVGRLRDELWAVVGATRAHQAARERRRAA